MVAILWTLRMTHSMTEVASEGTCALEPNTQGHTQTHAEAQIHTHLETMCILATLNRMPLRCPAQL